MIRTMVIASGTISVGDKDRQLRFWVDFGWLTLSGFYFLGKVPVSNLRTLASSSALKYSADIPTHHHDSSFNDLSKIYDPLIVARLVLLAYMQSQWVHNPELFRCRVRTPRTIFFKERVMMTINMPSKFDSYPLMGWVIMSYSEMSICYSYECHRHLQ